MRDSLGGIPILAIVTMFIVIALGYVAFNVNYTKAFRMKNKTIEIFKLYGGGDACNSSSECRKEIRDYADSIGYSTGGIDCNIFSKNGHTAKKVDDLLCYTTYSGDYYSVEEKKAQGILIDGSETEYNNVYTKINIELPIIKKFITSVSFFYVSGSTSPSVK